MCASRFGYRYNRFKSVDVTNAMIETKIQAISGDFFPQANEIR